MLSFSAITPGMCRGKQKGSPQWQKRKGFGVAIFKPRGFAGLISADHPGSLVLRAGRGGSLKEEKCEGF